MRSTLIISLVAVVCVSSAVEGNKTIRKRRKNRRNAVYNSLTRTAKDDGLEEDVAFWTEMHSARKLQFSAPTGGGSGPNPRPPTPPQQPPSPTGGGSGPNPRPPTPPQQPPSPMTEGGNGPNPRPPTPPQQPPSPPIPAPVASTPFPTYDVQTPNPTDPAMTGSPTYFPTSDSEAGAGQSPSGSNVGFNCPAATLVGCTAPDSNDPVDECAAVGQQCNNGNVGEFCCPDACPRNYCTAKQAPPMQFEFEMNMSMSMSMPGTIDATGVELMGV